MNRKMTIREKGKRWLLAHPKINPYKWFDPGVFRTITFPIRIMPDFLIIGMQKSGSSALYDYIIRHPDIYPALRKETHFFELEMGKRSYRSYFPTYFKKFLISKIQRKEFRTGEATPNYTFFPFCAKKIYKKIPKAKFIVILRNPVDRAYSQYQMKVRKHQENLSFEEGIEHEKERLQRKEGVSDIEYYNSDNFNQYAYLSRGLYAEQLKIWFKLFPKDQFFLVSTEELENNEPDILNKIFDFLDLPKFTLKEVEKVFVGDYESKMKDETRKKLIKYFKLHNEKLYKMIGRKFDWDK